MKEYYDKELDKVLSAVEYAKVDKIDVDRDLNGLWHTYRLTKTEYNVHLSDSVWVGDWGDYARIKMLEGSALHSFNKPRFMRLAFGNGN